MIVVDLMCDYKHRFEGWFASHEALDAQQSNGLLRCPVCDTTKVERLPSAPFVGRRSSDRAPDTAAVELDNAKALLRTLVQKLEAQAADAEDVGDEFSVEVLRIHHGEVTPRALRGTATADEIDNLLEEGVSLLPLPLAKEDLH